MPNTLAENLQRLVDARTGIASSITTKEGTVNIGDGLEEFPADILGIPSSSVEPLPFTLLPDVFTVDSNEPLTSVAYAYKIPLDAGLKLYVFGAGGKILNRLSSGAHFIEFDVDSNEVVQLSSAYLWWKYRDGKWNSYNDHASGAIKNGKGYGMISTNLDNNYSFCGGCTFITK